MFPGYADPMKQAVLTSSLVVALFVAFVLDHRNQAAFKLMLTNTATNQVVMKGVIFHFPFLPDPPAPKVLPSRYPKEFIWDDNCIVKYEDLGGGFLQTMGFRLTDGSVIKKDQDAWQGNFLFKYDPPDSPLHPGYAIVANNASPYRLAFADLGQVDFDEVRSIPPSTWLHYAPNEEPAIWNCQPGDVIGLRLEKIRSNPGETASGSFKTKVLYAKLMLDKLSYESVRFDYVFRVDGKNAFVPPNPQAD